MSLMWHTIIRDTNVPTDMDRFQLVIWFVTPPLGDNSKFLSSAITLKSQTKAGYDYDLLRHLESQGPRHLYLSVHQRIK